MRSGGCTEQVRDDWVSGTTFRPAWSACKFCKNCALLVGIKPTVFIVLAGKVPADYGENTVAHTINESVELVEVALSLSHNM